MRITITAVGSRGDVQPYLALGVALQRAGHAVCLATHDEFAPLAAEYGIDVAPLSGSPREMLETASGRTMLEAGENPLQFLAHFTRLTAPYFERFLGEARAACAGSDALVCSGTSIVTGYHLAEALRLPFIAALLQPFIPSAAVANPFFPPCPAWLAQRLYARFTHLAFGLLAKHLYRGSVRTTRRLLDLPPLRWREQLARLQRPDGPVLCAVSPSVIPPPADWPDTCRMTGYWFLDAAPGWQPVPALEAFLQAGPPPVYIGFGSMRSEDPQAMGRLVLRALEIAELRGVLFAGWGGLQTNELPETMLAIPPTPHSWLFPQLAAVVHHGGAGTTAAGLRAGVPSVVVPFFADQPFWADRVHQLGVGPRRRRHGIQTTHHLTLPVTNRD